MMRLATITFLCAACTDGGPSGPGIDGESHIESYFRVASNPPKIDVLFVVDDTTAMATHQQAIAALPSQLAAMIDSAYAGLGSYHIGLVTLQTRGFTTSTSPFGDPYHPEIRGQCVVN